MALDELIGSDKASHEVKLKALVDALSDSEWLVRATAAEHIATYQVHEAVASVREQLELEDHPTALVSLVEAIGEIGDPSDLPQLWRLAGSQDSAVRGFALAAIGELGGSADLRRLRQMRIESGLAGAALIVARLVLGDAMSRDVWASWSGDASENAEFLARELTHVRAKHPQVVASLRPALDAWVDNMRSKFPNIAAEFQQLV